MKKLIVTILSVAVFCNLYAQDGQEYNSVCVFGETSQAQEFLCTQIDSICFSLDNGGYVQNIWIGDDNISSAISEADSIVFFNPYVANLVEISSSTGVWGKAYLSPIGYFCYNSTLPCAADDVDRDDYEMLSFASFDKVRKADMIFSASTHLPVWMASDAVSVYFEYSQDAATYSLYIFDGSQAVADYEGEWKPEDDAPSDDELAGCLACLVALLDGNLGEHSDVQRLISDFESVTALAIGNDVPFLPKEGNEYVFAKERERQLVVDDIYYSVAAVTGNSLSVTPYSATVESAVRCASSQFRTNGVYGVLCDKNPDNLELGKAEFSAAGNQEKSALHYAAGIDGLTAGTEYYYRAYYRITNTGEDNNLEIRLGGDNTGTEAYGAIRKFTTSAAPTAVTGGTSEITESSATVECTYSDVPDGGTCGVEYSCDGNWVRQATSNENGTMSITIGNLTPATTYTYRAYIEAYGNTYYGEERTFTTSVPDISGMWKCVEEYSYRPFPNAEWETRTREYTFTLNQDGSMQVTGLGYDDIAGSWSLSANGNFSARVDIIATQTQNTYDTFAGTVNDVANPTVITGSRTRTNINQVSSNSERQGNFTMTRQ